MDNLLVYDWKKTIKENKNIKFSENFSNTINTRFVNKHSNGTINWEWENFELTDESEGKNIIFKCYLKSGEFKLFVNEREFKYDLKDQWMKISLIIKNNKDGLLKISDKNSHICIINSSLLETTNNLFLKNSVEDIFLNWFKNNLTLFEDIINKYKINFYELQDLSLIGWDTGYVTSFTNVNKAIKENAIYPKAFEEAFKDEAFGLEFSIKGTWKPWVLSPDSEGKNISFKCDINSGAEIIQLENNKKFTLSDNAYVKIQVRLKYFNIEDKTIEDNTGMGDGKQYNLKIKNEKDENGNKPIIILDTHFFDESPSPILEDVTKSMLNKWFLDNINKFEHIFSYFLLNETAKDPDFQWLKPTTAYYGVSTIEKSEGEIDFDKSVFGVMSMVENRVNSTPQHIVDARLLTATEKDAAFGISTPLFVQKWIEAGLLAMQIGTRDQFEIEDNGLTYRNKERILFGTIKNADGNDVPAYVDSKKLKVGMVNNQLLLDIEDLHWEQARGINGHVNFRQMYDITLKSGVDKANREYSNVLIPVESKDPTMLMSYTVEEWKEKENLIIEITTGLAIGLLVGAIPFGKAFPKLKSLVGKSFQQTGRRMSIEIGETLSRQMRTIVKESGDDLADSIREFSRRVSQDSIDEIGLHLNTGNTASSIIEQIAKKPKDILSKVWSNKYKLIGRIAAGTAVGMIPTITIKTMESMQKEYYSEIPTINEFVYNCVGTTKWPSTSEFKIESAQVRGIFLLGGTLTPDK